MPRHVWAIRVRLELAKNQHDLAPFNLAIDEPNSAAVTW